MVLRENKTIDEQIETWFYANTTDVFRTDAQKMYNLSFEDFMGIIKKAGAEFILNKNLDFNLRYYGSARLGTEKTHHIMSVELVQDKEVIHVETYTIAR